MNSLRGEKQRISYLHLSFAYIVVGTSPESLPIHFIPYYWLLHFVRFLDKINQRAIVKFPQYGTIFVFDFVDGL